MRPETDMEKIRAVAKTLLHLDIRPTSLSPMVVSHPFTNSGFVGLRDEDGGVRIGAITEDQEALARWRGQMEAGIDRAESPMGIAMMMNTPYLLTFIKYAKPYLSEPDLGHLLSAAWTMEEAPNRDPNLSRRSLAALFRSVSPEHLMDAEELRQLQALEDPVTVYRGVTSHNARNVRALSWTLDRDTAEGTELEGRVEVNNVWHSLRSMTREAGTHYQKVRRGFYQKGPPQRITAAPALEAPGGQSEIYQLMDQAIELLDRFESYSAKAREEQNLADGQEALAAIRRQVMRSLDDAVTGLSCWAAELEDLAEQPELDGPALTM